MKIFQLEIGKYEYVEFFSEITTFLENTKSTQIGRSIFTPNPEICLKTLQDKEFLNTLRSADYLTSDGIGLYLGYQINASCYPKFAQISMIGVYIFNILFRKEMLYKKYGERICGSDLTNSLLDYAQKTGARISIIDPYYPNDPEKCFSQESFKDKLSEKFPNLFFDFYVYSEENSDEIFRKIQKSKSKILFSTLGMKKQEISILRGLEKCPNLRLGLGIGSAFDYHTGFQKRAPKIFRDLGFEWLYRIFTSPNKLQRLGRIYQALIVFPVKVVFYKK